MSDATITGPVTYTIDQVAVITYKIRTDDGEGSARDLAQAVNQASVMRTGDDFECALDFPPGTTLDITTVGPRGRACVIYASDDAGREVQVTDGDLPDPLSGARRGELAAGLAAWRAAADTAGADAEHQAAARLAETVAALLAED